MAENLQFLLLRIALNAECWLALQHIAAAAAKTFAKRFLHLLKFFLFNRPLFLELPRVGQGFQENIFRDNWGRFLHPAGLANC